MGIFCEINLCKPADGRYTYQPGSIISGTIRYYLHEEYEFTSITVSLNGLGHLHLEDLSEKRSDRMYQYSNDEVYADLNNVIYGGEKGPLSVGQYETQFSFQLPFDIPASLDYRKDTFDYYVHCYVKYFVRITFDRPGWYKLNKSFEKELNVISGQTPRLPTEPLLYGDQKKLIQLSSLFSSKKSIVTLKATIANSVLKPEDIVRVDYEIVNDTNKTIKHVQVQLYEVDKYTTSGGREVKVHSEIQGAVFIHQAIPGGETSNFTAGIRIPEHCASIDHCKMLSRDYAVVTIVRLPAPHINLTLEIPFQVIRTPSSSFMDNVALQQVSIIAMIRQPIGKLWARRQRTVEKRRGEEREKNDKLIMTSSKKSMYNVVPVPDINCGQFAE